MNNTKTPRGGRRHFKLTLAVLLLLAMTLSGCGSNANKEEVSGEILVGAEQTTAEDAADTKTDADNVQTEDAQNAADSTTDNADASPSGEDNATSASTPIGDDGSIRPELTALEAITDMGNGINLGNTMEAYGHSSLGTSAATSSYETLWGQPVTTQEMITGMKEAGFDTLRVPVAWTNMMAYETGDYTIDTAYLDRVEEIIGYARNAGMYVIVNDHWDGSWWGMFGSASSETRDKAMDLYVSMWTQIAERYANYSDYLIFESANEELGNRLNDTDVAADSGALSQDECYEMANKINQVFVDTIRAAGGNNAERFLLIAGYNTDIAHTCDSRFQMPTDTADHKLMLSVHYYTPSGYCLTESINQWGTRKNYEEQNTLLADMAKFTEDGYGIVIGEYGVLEGENNSVKQNHAEYLTNFLNNCDLYNYCPVLWDCSFMYQRKELSMRDETIAAIYKDYSYANQSATPYADLQAAAETAIAEALENAPAAFDENAINIDDGSKAVAWIMYNSNDWNTSYSVGDVYSPDAKTAGIVATDVEITGAGTYTVALDFTGTSGGYADGTAFSALAIGNGELLYPGYVVTIKEIKVNGEPIKMNGRAYTASDDKKCTRVNLFNSWVPTVPDDARTPGGGTTGCSACIINPDDWMGMETLEITFEYIAGK